MDAGEDPRGEYSGLSHLTKVFFEQSSHRVGDAFSSPTTSPPNEFEIVCVRLTLQTLATWGASAQDRNDHQGHVWESPAEAACADALPYHVAPPIAFPLSGGGGGALLKRRAGSGGDAARATRWHNWHIQDRTSAVHAGPLIGLECRRLGALASSRTNIASAEFHDDVCSRSCSPQHGLQPFIKPRLEWFVEIGKASSTACIWAR